MYCGTRTEPYSQTRPRSLRPRSTSMTCSARSFSLRFSSSASRRSSSSLRAARPRAGDRVRLDAPAFDAHEHLRRRADDRQAAHPDEIHVRRRVDVAQRAVDGERIGRDVRLEPLRQHRLVDVAGGDPLLDRRGRRPRRSRASVRRGRPARRRSSRLGLRQARARARARGTGSSRRRTGRARCRSSSAVTRALAMIRIRCLT